jgi:hypothetical protein
MWSGFRWPVPILVAGSCERRDETSGSGAAELVSWLVI